MTRESSGLWSDGTDALIFVQRAIISCKSKQKNLADFAAGATVINRSD
jgi:hypothetical protein